jgi:hypothetical protein
MPYMRKLTREEAYSVEQQSKCRRLRTTELYDSLLAQFSAGDYGEVAVKTSESRTNLRNRLHAAAARRGLALRFLYARRKRLRFRVEPQPKVGTERPATSVSDLLRQPSPVRSPGLPVAACGA